MKKQEVEATKPKPEAIPEFLARLGSVAYNGRYHPSPMFSLSSTRRPDTTPIAITIVELERLLALAKVAGSFADAIRTFSESAG